MGKSSYSNKIISAALAAAAYIGNPNTSEAQTKSMRYPIENRILSSDRCYSATGEGVYLKNFCFDLDLSSDSKIDLKENFKLSALRKDIDYSVVSGKDGIRYGLRFLATQPKTGVRDASIAYLRTFLGRTAENDENSVKTLSRIVSDGVIEGKEIFNGDSANVEGGRYAIITKSKFTRGSQNDLQNTMPILVNVFYGAERTRKDSVARAAAKVASDYAAQEKLRVADSTATVERNAQRVKRDNYVADSTSKTVKDSVAREKAKETLITGRAKKVAYDQFTGKRYGFEMGYGLENKEVVLGASVGVFSFPGMNLGLYAQQLMAPGRTRADTVVETSARERELVGPGTYRDRTDQITTVTSQAGLSELGLEALLFPTSRFPVSLRYGLGFSKESTDISGNSTITVTRNDQIIGGPTPIENSIPTQNRQKNNFASSIGAQAYLKLTSNFGVGVDYHLSGKQKGFRASAKVRF